MRIYIPYQARPFLQFPAFPLSPKKTERMEVKTTQEVMDELKILYATQKLAYRV